MENFKFYSPTYFAFGKDSELEVGKLLKKFGAKKVLIHYSNTAERTGLLALATKKIEEEGIFFMELGGVVPNPESSLVYEGIKLCKENSIDFILAIGGGSVIDSAKAIAAGSIIENDFWFEYFDKNHHIIDKALKVGVILTIAATGSEASPSVVITNSITKQKRGASGDGIRPTFAIMNPAITTSLPWFQTACGIVDMISHILERYFSNSTDTLLTDALCEATIRTIITEARKLMLDSSDYQARANIMWAATIAHNNILGVGRVQDWACHKIEHELSGKYNITHGAGLAVIIPRWMHYVSKINPHKFYSFATNIFEVSGLNDNTKVEEGIKLFEEFLKEMKMPTTLKEINYKETDLDELINNIDFNNGEKLGFYVPLDKEDIRKIYQL